jgi:hypothetical protein
MTIALAAGERCDEELHGSGGGIVCSDAMTIAADTRAVVPHDAGN